MITLVFAMAPAWILICVGCWLFFQLARQNGRILVRLEGIEDQLVLLRGLLHLKTD
jgi:hypothetical protein